MIFANIKLLPGEDPERLKSLGLKVINSRPRHRADGQASPCPPKLAQPCAAFDGCRCQIYAERPRCCREFDCSLLGSVKAGRLRPAAALGIIRDALEKTSKVRKLLQTLGDADEAAPLAARFRRTAKRLEAAAPDNQTAEVYGQLTLAFHDLNLLLSGAFYPGSSLP